MNTRIKGRWLSWLLALMMIFNSFPMATFATEIESHDHVHDETCTVQHDEDVSEISEEESSEVSSDEPSPEPTQEPTPAPTAEPTPEPTVEPTATPAPSEEPNPTPAPTEKPVELSAEYEAANKMAEDFAETYGVNADMSSKELSDAIIALDGSKLESAWNDCNSFIESLSELNDEELEALSENPNAHVVVRFYETLQTIMSPSLMATSGTFTPVTGINVSVSGATDCSESGGAVTVTAQGSGGLFGIGASAKTATITVTNSLADSAKVSFDWAATSVNELKIDGTVYTGSSGSFTKVLAGGASFTITVTTAKNNTTNKLVMSNFATAAVAAFSNVTFDYDDTLGTVTVDGAAVKAGEAVEVQSSGGALVATVNSGVNFLGWVNAEDNAIISTEATYTLIPGNDMTVKAVFTNAQKSAWFRVGKTHIYDDLNAAAEKAQETKTNVILAADGVLPKGDYTIPSGVTLLVPFDSADTCYVESTSSVKGSVTTPKAFRTLIMEKDAHITINGTMSISAKQFAANGGERASGMPYEYYGYVRTEEGSTITVNDGGKLAVYGYIVGNGSVTAKKGAKVYESFQFEDFRGGSQIDAMENRVFAFSQYYVQNIEIPLTIEAGATEYSYASIEVGSISTAFGSSVAFISDSGAMFNLGKGSVTKYYDKATDRLVIESNDGDMTVNPIKVSIGTWPLTISIDSSDYVLPINSNMTIKINSGNITLGQDVALLPGSELIVCKGAQCYLSEGTKIYVYDADEWGTYAFASGDYKLLPVTYVPERQYKRTEADLVDAQITVEGIMDGSAGFAYTTASGAEICGVDGAVVTLTDGTETVTYQYRQAANTYDQIPITTLKLKNADGTYVTTTTGTYQYMDGLWHGRVVDDVFVECDGTTTKTKTKDATCTETGLMDITCACGLISEKDVVIPATGHSYSVTTAAVAETCTTEGKTAVETCSECSDTKGGDTIAALGHDMQFSANLNLPTCTETGNDTYKCSRCSFTDTVEVPATGHTKTEIPAVAPTCEKTGLTAGVKCSVCNTVITAQDTVDALGHKPGTPKIETVVPAKCTTSGVNKSIVECETCGEVISTEEIIVDALGHTEAIDKAKDATCTETGLTEGKHCSVCGTVLVAQTEIPAKGHDMVVVKEHEVLPSCTAEGSYENVEKCRNCDYKDESTRKKITVDMLPHTKGEVEIKNNEDPTCTEDGSYDKVVSCTVCSEIITTETITVPATGHTEGEPVVKNEKAPTCTEKGSYDTVVYCTVCDVELERTTREVSAKGHTEVTDNRVEPTCTSEGLTAGSHCGVCGETLVAQEKIEKIAHNTMPVPGKEPTCTEAGYTPGEQCINCFTVINQTEIPALGHTEVTDEAVVPTCTETGLTEGSHCSACGEVLVAQETVDALGHTEVIDEAVAPKCTETGLTEGKHCSVCEEVIVAQTVVKALGHTEVVDEAVAPTCTETGLTEGKYCSVCGVVLVAQTEVEALGHTEVIDESVAPTCTETGLTEGKHCSVCEEVLVAQETVDALGHTEVIDEAVAPTCTETGLTEGKHCSVCEDILVAQEEVPVKPHAYDEGVVTTEPTCTEDGVRTYTCADCGESKTEIIEAGHTWVNVDIVREPTCTISGIEASKECSVCGEREDEKEIPATGHKWIYGDYSPAPSCKNDGYVKVTCEVEGCNTTDLLFIPKLEHKNSSPFIENEVPATCTASGSYDSVVYCVLCGSELNRETITIEATGHSEEELKAVAPTCTESGLTAGTGCSVCGEIFVAQEIVEALGHTEVVDEKVAPDCENDGFTEGKHCSVCGETLVAQKVILALGHDTVIDAAVAATCTETGLTEGSHCERCHEVFDAQEIIEALGHTEVDDKAVVPTCTETGLTEGKHCSVCEEVLVAQETVEALGHTEVIDVAVDATCTKTGLTEGKHCEVCGEILVAQEIVEALGHTGNNVQVENKVEPTCTKEGSHDVVTSCSVCGAEVSRKTEVDPALGHKVTVMPAKEPTCIATGRTEYEICSVCSEMLKAPVIIDAKGHNEVIDAAVPATCTTDGLTEGAHCDVCNEILKVQTTVKAFGHTVVTDKAVAPTCETDGFTEGKHCSVCGEVFTAQDVIPALGHEYVIDKAVAPTCDKDGSEEGCHCSVCGEIFVAQKVIPALGHKDVVDPAVKETCTTAGKTEGKHCEVCGEVLVPQEEIPALGHKRVTDAAVPATCTQTGLTQGEHCETCGHVFADQKVIPVLGHSEVTVVGKPAGCETTGITDGIKCGRCDEIIKAQEEIPAVGHKEVIDEAVAPTCTETGLTEGKHCSVCGQILVPQDVVAATGHKEEIIPAVAPTCTENGSEEGVKCSVCGTIIKAPKAVSATGHTEVNDAPVAPGCVNVGLTQGKHCSVCGEILVPQDEIPALGHTEVIDAGVAATCTKTGLTEGKHCSVCREVIVKQEIIPLLEHTWDAGRVTVKPSCEEEGVRTFNCIVCRTTKDEAEPALGHDLVQVPAKAPTYTSGGWEAYEYCQRDTNDSEKCIYSTIVHIAPLGEPSIENYDEFIENLAILEDIADIYVKKVSPGKDPAMLIIKYIRTGVDRYNSGSWNIMAGYEDKDFAKYVTSYEAEYNANLPEGEELMKVSGLKDIKNFNLPNGNYADIGHMFGTMDITYTKKSNADVGGWGGDLTDLISLADQYGVESETLEEMVAEIKDNYFLWSEEDVEDAHGGIKVLEGTFSETDVFGDLDGFYVMEELEKREYKNGTLTDIISSYMTPSLTNNYRASYFIENRLNGTTHRVDLRNAVYNEYTSNEAIATLENTREFNTENLTMLRRACCYVFADYICKVAGDYYEFEDNPYLSVFQTETTDLAPGIVQKTYLATTADNQQLAYYTATADVNRADVDLFVNYNNNDPSQGWAMQRVLDQANAAQNRFGNPESEEYIENYQVIASTNGDGYNMETGEPSGLLMMRGTEWHAPKKGEGFFGILSDGTAIIGSYNEYMALKESGKIREALGSFGTTLIEDGKFAVTPSTDYFTDRAGRTAIGITATGKVVMMVADGRQQPFSCGASMQEIAQIMLEAGCVEAINLDGGGSTTYVAKLPGDDELSVVNRPSDGVARSVSSSLFVVSTAPSSTAFDHALVDATNTYLTVGATTNVNAVALSATGNSVEMPEGTYWTVSDTDVGTVTEDGVFTATGLGETKVNLMLGDEVVGSRTLYVVVPDNVYFTKETITGIYGQPVHLPIKAVYEGKDVAIVESDVILSVANKDAGEINGFEFIGYESSGLKKIKVNGALAHDTSITTSINITMYTEDEASFDFENATGGDYQLSWNREVSNSTVEGTNVYRANDTEVPMLTDYTFAIDMSKIDIPPQLESLTYMLPGADMENASAWNFLLQLAERVSVLTEVKAEIKFDDNLTLVSDIAAGDVTVVNEYFVLKPQDDENPGIVYNEETNTLTLTLNWVDQTEAIDPDTANPLCIVSGIKLAPKDDASWNSKNQLVLANAGEISYDIYLRANALYTFANKTENQEIYGLYPFENLDWDPVERGGHFSSTYKDFSDNYTLVNSVKDGWVTETGGFAYYKDGEKLTGLHEIDGLFYDFGTNGINVGQTPFNGIYTYENGDEYWFINGERASGWYLLYDRVEYFNPETYKAELVTTVEDVPDGCIIPGYRIYVSESGAEKRIDDDTNTGGHEYVEQENGDFVCSVCGYVRKNMDEATVQLSYYVCTYNGNARVPTVTAYAKDGTYLTKYSDSKYPDYNIHRYDNVDVGTSTVTLKAYKRGYYVDRNQWRGNAAGEISVTFEIRPDLPTNVKMTAIDGTPALTWTAAKAPGVTYVIYTSEDGENWTEIGSTTDTSYVLDPAECVDKSIKVGTRKEVDGKVYESLKMTSAVKIKKINATPANRDSDGKPRLLWNAVTGVDHYEVYRATSPDGEFTRTYTTEKTTYTNTSAKLGETYYYQLRAVMADGTVRCSSIIENSCLFVDVKITTGHRASDGKPKLTWSAVEGAVKYEVYRSTSADSGFSRMFSTTNRSYVNSKAVEGITYYYKLKVFFADGTYAFTKTVTNSCKDLTLPMSIVVGNRADGKPTLSWTALANVKNYVVMRSKSATGSFGNMFTTTGTKYTNTNATEGQTYFYKIKVTFKDGTIGYSPVVENTCLVPDIDLNVKVTNRASDGKPKLTWTAAAGAKEYKIYRSTERNGKYTRMLTTKNTSYTNTNAVAGQTYYYKIVVVMNNGKEKFTTIFSATCLE